jgi:hypothetical protein
LDQPQAVLRLDNCPVFRSQAVAHGFLTRSLSKKPTGFPEYFFPAHWSAEEANSTMPSVLSRSMSAIRSKRAITGNPKKQADGI